jgi:hypothetical protein
MACGLLIRDFPEVAATTHKNKAKKKKSIKRHPEVSNYDAAIAASVSGNG